MISIYDYWADTLRQDPGAMAAYFAPEAWVNWHNTNEHFTAEEFIRANCEYPGNWGGEVEKVITAADTVITVVRVFDRDSGQSFHVTSFIGLSGEKIATIDEYWGDDGPAPKWRQELNLGRKLK